MKKIILIVVAMMMISAPTLHARTVTFIEGSDGNDAYTTPFYEYAATVPYEFEDVRDITVKNDVLYVVDTNGIIVFNPDGKGFIIGENVVSDPQGIFIDNNEIYLADKGAQTVFVFNLQGNLLRQYDRPTETYYGEKTPYAPVDVVVSSNGLIYIASEGTVDGLICLEKDGSFLSFYGANSANESFYNNLISNNELLPNSIKPKPASITNIEIDDMSSVYTMTQNTKSGIKRLNFDGNDTFENQVLDDTTELKDFVVDQYGNVFTIDNANILVYNPQGNKLFYFWDNSIANPIQIGVSEKEELYIYDGDEVRYYKPTESVMLLYQAADLYYNGELEDAKLLWEKFLEQKTSFYLAFQSIAEYEYQNKNYDQALDLYEKAGSKEGYSSAMYFVRNDFIKNNIGYIILVIIALYSFVTVYKKYVKDKIKKTFASNWLLKDLKYVKMVLKDPKTVLYEIKYKNNYGYMMATILYVIALIVFLVSSEYSCFLFAPPQNNIPNALLVVLFISVIAIVLLVNNFVSTVMYSEARLGQMYRALSLVFVPYILLTTVNLVIGYALTLNEAVIYGAISFVTVLWMFIILYNVISDMHNYQIGNTYKNMLLTIFTIIVLSFVTITILYLIISMVSAIYQILLEVF